MSNQITVTKVEDGEHYADGPVYGSTVTVTLQRGHQFVKCEGIRYFQEEDLDNETFGMWLACAQAGEEGYSTW